jgi:hypothetical protein
MLEAAVVNLNPSKDNTLIQQSDSSAQVSNALGDLFVGRTNHDGSGPATISIRRGLLAFDVAGNVPAGATIVSAALTMRDVQGFNGDSTVELHRVTADWGEAASFQNGGLGAPATTDDATWLYRFYKPAPTGSGPTWATPGGDFSNLVSAAAEITDDLGAGQLFTWSTVGNPQMLSDVQAWLDYAETNFGWALLGDETKGQTIKRFNSGESATLPNVPPALRIEYVLPRPGDFDGNSVVDGADLAIWRANAGLESGAMASEGDADGNGSVDGGDFLIWQRNSGMGPAAVPEPSAWLLVAVGFGHLFRRTALQRRASRSLASHEPFRSPGLEHESLSR